MQAGNKRRHIPAEMVEEILLNLPVKSLVRFSSVSKSWMSMIFGPGFVKRYRGCATLPGRERMAIRPSCSEDVNNYFSFPLSSISDQKTIEDATEIIRPFEGKPYIIRALCDELWCVEVEKSLFLWNPSLRTYKKLPDPLVPLSYCFVYKLGYDSIGDDYKILKNPIGLNREIHELYSLKSDSWKKIQPFPGGPFCSSQGQFVMGAFHWMDFPHNPRDAIISFDLSTEKYGEVVQPDYYPILDNKYTVQLIALRGMLCVFLYYYKVNKFVVWVMEEYGVAKSWTKMFDTNFYKAIPYFVGEIATYEYIALRPLYFYNTGEILIKVIVICNTPIARIFMYKDENTIPRMIVDNCSMITDGSDDFLYVESLVSPPIWPTTAAPMVGNN